MSLASIPKNRNLFAFKNREICIFVVINGGHIFPFIFGCKHTRNQRNRPFRVATSGDLSRVHESLFVLAHFNIPSIHTVFAAVRKNGSDFDFFAWFESIQKKCISPAIHTHYLRRWLNETCCVSHNYAVLTGRLFGASRESLGNAIRPVR